MTELQAHLALIGLDLLVKLADQGEPRVAQMIQVCKGRTTDLNPPRALGRTDLLTVLGETRVELTRRVGE
jgi:hypothetical protein